MKIYANAEYTAAPNSGSFDSPVDAYIQICDDYPEYYENEGIAAHVDYRDGTANFMQVAPNKWQIVIFNEDEYNPDTYVYENDPYWGTDELMPGEMNDIILTSAQCYNELKNLPGVNLDNFYGIRQVFDDFPEIFN